VKRGGDQVLAIPGIDHFGSHIGQAFLGEEVQGTNFAESWVSMSKNADYNKTIDSIRHFEDQNPGVFHDVQTYLRERVDEVLAGSTEAVVVRIFGPDLKVLRSTAGRISNELQDVKGLVDVHPDQSQDVPQARVRVKLPVASRYGLKPGDVRRAAATLISGEEVGDQFRNGKVYGVSVWSTPQTRRNMTDVERLPIDVPSGGQVPLGRVADVRLVPTPSAIAHENESRRIDVGANISGRDLGSAVADVRKKLDKIKFPLGYHAELLGEANERQKAQNRLLLLAVGAAILTFLLLQAAFRSWRLAAMLFFTLPMALVGGLLAASAAVGTISLGALIGFYAVLGIAARNGIMMITHFQHLERYEDEPFGLGLVVRGARERLRPILMTATATGLALLPLAITGDKPGQEIEHPMALVILGGLVTSTLLNLFVVPALYLRFGRGASARPTASDEEIFDRAIAKVYAPLHED
jgi:Cu/Ag efflux pump CusA